MLVHDLVAILRAAYSGELAAGLAYRGHWKSLRDPEERRRIGEIEAEEWHHRALVGDMLAACGACPSRPREAVFWTIGRVLGALCHMTGWLAPMYGAGRLESQNVVEYETAARRAAACGRHEWIECLLTMAEVEWEHEAYFRARVQSHRLARWVPMWQAPAPKETIRSSFPTPLTRPARAVLRALQSAETQPRSLSGPRS